MLFSAQSRNSRRVFFSHSSASSSLNPSAALSTWGLGWMPQPTVLVVRVLTPLRASPPPAYRSLARARRRAPCRSMSSSALPPPGIQPSTLFFVRLAPLLPYPVARIWGPGFLSPVFSQAFFALFSYIRPAVFGASTLSALSARLGFTFFISSPRYSSSLCSSSAWSMAAA